MASIRLSLQPGRSLRAGIGARYSYYVQLVATKRDWMPVANLKSRQRGGEAGRAQSCRPLVPRVNNILMFVTWTLP